MGKKHKKPYHYAIIIVVFVFFLVYMLVTEGVENIANCFCKSELRMDFSMSPLYADLLVV